LKKIFTLIYTVILVLAMTGCSSGGISTFTAAVETMPSNFDPQIASKPEDLMVITNVFDCLFERLDGEIVNNVAENCTISPDGRTYTITLKKDSVFHCRGNKSEQFNNTGVTAHDFVFALQRICDPKTHSPYIDDFSNISGAKAVRNGASVSSLGVSAKDDYTLVIQLENADYNFTEKLAMTAAAPCNEAFFRRTGGAYGLSIDNILSNGPFRLNYLDSENGNATIISVREDDKSYISRIRLVQADAAQQAEKYIDESISGYFAYSSVNTSYSNTSALSFDSGNISLVFNLTDSNLNNANIRKALGWYAYGFINSGANMAAVESCTTIFPDTVTIAGKYINELISAKTPAYMSENPKQLLQQGLAELGQSKLSNIRILMPDDSLYTLIYENINQLWQKNLGQFFTIEYMPSSQIKQRISSGDFDIAFIPLSPDNNTVYGVIDRYAPYNSQLAAIAGSAKSMADQTNAVNSISQTQQIIIDEALSVPMGSEKTVFHYRSNFRNIYVDPFTNVINLKYAISE